jgi:hypothetical protein
LTEPATLHDGADKLAQAKLKQEQREQGIRAQAIQEGMRKATADIELRLGKQALESGPLLAAHAKELDRRDALHATALEIRDREESKHVKAGWWKGFSHGLMLCVPAAALAFLAAFLVIDAGQKAAFDAASQSSQQGFITGAATRSQEP